MVLVSVEPSMLLARQQNQDQLSGIQQMAVQGVHVALEVRRAAAHLFALQEFTKIVGEHDLFPL